MPFLAPVQVVLLLLLFVAGGASARSLEQGASALTPTGTGPLHKHRPHGHSNRQLHSAVVIQHNQPAQPKQGNNPGLSALDALKGRIFEGIHRELAAPADAAGVPSNRLTALREFAKKANLLVANKEAVSGSGNPLTDSTVPINSLQPSPAVPTPSQPVVPPSLKEAAPVVSKQAADTSRNSVGPVRLQEWKQILEERKGQRQNEASKGLNLSPSPWPNPTSPIPSPILNPDFNPPSPRPAAPVVSKQGADMSRKSIGPVRLQEWKQMLEERKRQRQNEASRGFSPSPSPQPNPTSPIPSPIPTPSPNPAPSPNPSPSPDVHHVVLPPLSPSLSPAPPASPSPTPPVVPSPSPAPPSPSPSPQHKSPSPSPAAPSPDPSPTPDPSSSPSPPPESPSPSPVPDPPAPNAGVIAGAVTGAIGGLALILAATWLIRHCRHRRSRGSRSSWEDRDALGPLYTVGSAQDPQSSFFPQIVHSSPGKHSGRTAVAAAPAAAAAAGDVAPVLDTGRGAMALGFTGDELQGGLSDLKHVVTNKLLPAVDNSPLARSGGTDVIATWLDAGMASVRSHSNYGRDYTASHTFVDDWRTHKVWDWLHNRYWRHIPTNKRLMHVQAPTQATLSQLSYARYTLNQINQDHHFRPFADAVDAAVRAMLQDAATLAASTGAVVQNTTASSSGNARSRAYTMETYPISYTDDNSDLPGYDESVVPSMQTQQAAMAAANAYYRPVLRELCEAALRCHLQVQGTAEGMFIHVPGAADTLQMPVPSEGLVATRRPGGIREVCMCSRPGVLSTDVKGAGGVSVWVPAYAVCIIPQ